MLAVGEGDVGAQVVVAEPGVAVGVFALGFTVGGNQETAVGAWGEMSVAGEEE